MSAVETWLERMPQEAVPEARRGMFRTSGDRVLVTNGHVIIFEPARGRQAPEITASVDHIDRWFADAADPLLTVDSAALREIVGPAEWPRLATRETCPECNGTGLVDHDCDCWMCAETEESCPICDADDGPEWVGPKLEPVRFGPVLCDRGVLAQAVDVLPAGEVVVFAAVATYGRLLMVAGDTRIAAMGIALHVDPDGIARQLLPAVTP